MTAIDYSFLETGQKWDQTEILDLHFNFSTQTPNAWSFVPNFTNNYEGLSYGLEFSGLSNPNVYDQKDITRFLLINPDHLDDFNAGNTVNTSLVNSAVFRSSFEDIISAGFSEDLNGEVQLINHQGNLQTTGSLALLPQAIVGSGGDIVINYLDPEYDDLEPGKFGYWIILHELGHAIGGLDDFQTGDPAEYNNQKYSMMSYNTYGGVYASGLQLLDIAALQDTYGTVNTSTRSGNTVYSLGNGLGFHGANANDAFLYTIWDGGGTDTIDASGFNVSAEIDLREGKFSSIGKNASGTAWSFDVSADANDPDPGNIAIAYGVEIENAVGTDQGDFIYGNDLDNTIIGGAGADTITLGGGRDTLRGTVAEMNGDTVTDFEVGDRIELSAANTSLHGLDSDDITVNTNTIEIDTDGDTTPDVTINAAGFGSNYDLIVEHTGTADGQSYASLLVVDKGVLAYGVRSDEIVKLTTSGNVVSLGELPNLFGPNITLSNISVTHDERIMSFVELNSSEANTLKNDYGVVFDNITSWENNYLMEFDANTGQPVSATITYGYVNPPDSPVQYISTNGSYLSAIYYHGASNAAYSYTNIDSLALGPSYGIINTSGWTSIETAPDGTVYGIRNNGGIYSFSATGSSFVSNSLTLGDLFYNAAGDLYFHNDNNNKIYTVDQSDFSLTELLTLTGLGPGVLDWDGVGTLTANVNPDTRDDQFETEGNNGVNGNLLIDNGNGFEMDANSDSLSVVVQTAAATSQGGTVTTSSDGDFSYTPGNGFVGTDSFDYTVEDGQGGSSVGTAYITVTAPPNFAPVAQDDVFTGTEEQNVAGNLLTDNGNGVDSDVESDPLSVQNEVITSAQGATVTILANGDFTYVPVADFYGSDSFTYTLLDDQGGSDTGTVTITLSNVNDAPVAQDDSFTGTEDQNVTGNLLVDNGNGVDTDPESDPLSIQNGVITSVQGATVTILANGDFTYVPVTDFNGNDSFTYTLLDGQGGSDTGAVTINLSSVNDNPVAEDDAFSGDEDTDITGNVLADNGNGVDSDADADTLSVSAQTSLATAQGGSVDIASNGDFTYTPASGYYGADSFTYTLQDGNSGTDTGTVTLTVNEVLPYNPVTGTSGVDTLYGTSSNDKVEGFDGNDKLYGYAGNDWLIGGAGNDWLYDGWGTSGLNILENGAEVTPDNYWIVATSNDYSQNRIIDGAGSDSVQLIYGTGAGQWALITRNDLEFEWLGGDDIGVTADNGSGAKIDLILEDQLAELGNSNGLGIEWMRLSLSHSNNTADWLELKPYLNSATFISNGSSGNDTLAGIQAASYEDHILAGNGDDILQYILSENGSSEDVYEGGIGTDTLQLYLTSAEYATQAIIDDIDAARLYIDQNANSATASGNFFNFTAFDLDAGQIEVLEVYVDGVLQIDQDPPVAQDDAFTGTEDQSVTGNLLVDNGNGVDTDPESDPLSVQNEVITSVQGATVTILSNGNFTYVPVADFNGSDSFTYTLLDGQGGSDTGTVTITLSNVNDAPVAQNDAFSGDEDTQITGNLLSDNGNGADSDADNDTLSVTAQTSLATAQGGSVDISSNGDFTYTPASGFFGTDSFDYTVLDGQSASDTGTVTLNVNEVIPYNQITGTSGVDNLYGTSAADKIEGLASNDKLYGYADDDWLIGGAGNDWLYDGWGTSGLNILENGSEVTPDNYWIIANTNDYAQNKIIDGAGSDSVQLVYGTGTGQWALITRYDLEFEWLGGDDIRVTADNGSGAKIDLILEDQLAELGNSNGLGIEWMRLSLSHSNNTADWLELKPHLNTATFISNGTSGNDTLSGIDTASEKDQIFAGGGDDILYGQDGYDELWGETGADTFVFEAASAYNDIDVVKDFSTTDNDVLDLIDLLGAYDPLNDLITDFVQITDSGSDSIVSVDADGGANSFTQIATLENITGLTDEASLESSGVLSTS